VYADGTNGANLYDISKNRIIRKFHFPVPWCMAVRPKHGVLAIAGDAWSAKMFDISTGELLKEILPGKKYDNSPIHPFDLMQFSANGAALLLGKKVVRMHMYESYTWKKRIDIGIQRKQVTCATFDVTGKFVITGGDDRFVRIFDVFTGKEVFAFESHDAPVTCCAISPNGRVLTTGSKDTTVALWDFSKIVKSATKPMSNSQAAERLELWWRLLGEKDASKAWRAIGNLVSSKDASVDFLKGKLIPIPIIKEVTLSNLIDDLSSDEFERRRVAFDRLTHYGRMALPFLEKELKKPKSLEASIRLKKLINYLTDYSPEVLRSLRGVETLEYIANDSSQALLRRLSKGAPGAWITEAAIAASKRLKSRE